MKQLVVRKGLPLTGAGPERTSVEANLRGGHHAGPAGAFLIEEPVLLGRRHRDHFGALAGEARTDLGRADEIGKVFSGFQKYLYQDVA